MAKSGYYPYLSNKELLDYYLRDDVTCVLWEMSRRRPVRFFYRTDSDIRVPHAKAEFTTLHCLDGAAEFRDRVRRLLETAAPSRQPFCPFFGMQPAVNLPGKREHPIGWDLRYEIDFDLRSSFRALIPVVAVLRHFRVPALVKFSGHRSLHVMIPAEAFPSAMKKDPVHKQWLEAFSILGSFLARFTPVLTSTATGIAKDASLTAPYSLHRYRGGVSLPLDLSQSLEFSPKRAELSGFTGIDWDVSRLDTNPGALQDLFGFIERAEAKTGLVLDLAEEVFGGRAWQAFVQNGLPGEAEDRPILAALMTGLPAVSFKSPKLPSDPARLRRLRSALEVIDRPQSKGMKLLRMIADPAWNSAQPADSRRPVAECLECWVQKGFRETLAKLMALAESSPFSEPVNFALRVLSILPEPHHHVLKALSDAWSGLAREPGPRQLFVVLALGELSSKEPSALKAIAQEDADSAELAVRSLLAGAGPWRAEERPDLAVATLSLAFGFDSVFSWLDAGNSAEATPVIEAVFAGKKGKFEFAIEKLHKVIDAWRERNRLIPEG